MIKTTAMQMRIEARGITLGSELHWNPLLVLFCYKLYFIFLGISTEPEISILWKYSHILSIYIIEKNLYVYLYTRRDSECLLLVQREALDFECIYRERSKLH